MAGGRDLPHLYAYKDVYMYVHMLIKQSSYYDGQGISFLVLIVVCGLTGFKQEYYILLV